MTRTLKLMVFAASFAASISGCIVRESRPPPPGCPYGAFWVEGFRDGYGVWPPRPLAVPLMRGGADG